jgi:hypothetical protein
MTTRKAYLKSKHDGYVLVSKSGKYIPDTFNVVAEECWSLSFDYLYARFKWMRPYWKQWNESILAAEKRGWVVKKARIMVKN